MSPVYGAYDLPTGNAGNHQRVSELFSATLYSKKKPILKGCILLMIGFFSLDASANIPALNRKSSSFLSNFRMGNGAAPFIHRVIELVVQQTFFTFQRP
jgi:hypothetical protein